MQKCLAKCNNAQQNVKMLSKTQWCSAKHNKAQQNATILNRGQRNGNFIHFTYCDALMSYFDVVACVSLKSQNPISHLLAIFWAATLLVFKRLLGTREKTCVTDYLENSPMYVVNHCLLVFRWFLRSFEVPSRVAVEGERHYFMYASICYFCKNENRKKNFYFKHFRKANLE